MAKIEERAKQAVQENYNCKGEYPCSKYKDCVFGCGTNTAYDCEECGADEFEVGYLKGSTEQQKIDIDKACECFRQELKHFVRMLDCIKEGSGEIIDVEGSIESFRKAMEE